MHDKVSFYSHCGRPNVGKSSLLNKLLGEKVAIVSNKPQTTRNRIMGVLTRDAIQYVFIDTPGLHKPKSRLGSFMLTQAESAVSDVDVLILVTEWDKPISEVERAFCNSITKQKVPLFLQSTKLICLNIRSDCSRKSISLWRCSAFPLSCLFQQKPVMVLRFY